LETEMTTRFAQRLGTLLLALAAGGVSLVPAHATGGNVFLSAQERAIDELGGWTVDADYEHCKTPINPKTEHCRALGAPLSPNAWVSTPDGHGHMLSAWVVHEGMGPGQEEVIMFRDARLLGQFDQGGGGEFLLYELHASGIAQFQGTVHVYKSTDPQCCASGLFFTDIFSWNGSKVQLHRTQITNPVLVTTPAAPPIPSDECEGFRNSAWQLTQRIATLQSQWWTVLQRDYGGNYPPAIGGSVPGVNQQQFLAAQADMNQIHVATISSSSESGIEWDIARLADQYGVSLQTSSGAFNWAATRMFNAAHSLDVAAYFEWQASGTGIGPYHQAQQYLTFSWDALKQLSCTATPVNYSPLFVRVVIKPSTMKYDAYPTIYAWSSRGASCSASVRYTTGYPPRSFNGATQVTAMPGASVSWTWHEETKGSGGTATVKCTSDGQTKTATASFRVTG